MKLNKTLKYSIITIFVCCVLVGCINEDENACNKYGHKIYADFNKIEYNGEMFLAVGIGLIIHSKDGITWTQVIHHPYVTYRENGFSMVAIDRCVYGDGMWIVAGLSAIAYSKDDCATWTKIPSSQPNFYAGMTGLAGMAYGAGKFVFISNMQISYSKDGLLWETIEDYPFNPHEEEVAVRVDVKFNNGRFIAVRGSEIAYSDDGITWNLVEKNFDNTFYSLAYGAGKWIAVGTATIYSTDNGYTWELSSNPYRSIAAAYGDGKFIAISYVGSGRAIISEDGITWKLFEDLHLDLRESIGPFNLVDVTYGAGKFVLVEYNGYVIYSTDTINWETTRIEVDWETGVRDQYTEKE